MKIYFFEIDPDTKFIRAGFTHNGKRYIRLVQAQNGESYVVTGSNVTKDLVRHNFTKNQENRLSAFLYSPLYSIEFPEAVE